MTVSCGFYTADVRGDDDDVDDNQGQLYSAECDFHIALWNSSFAEEFVIAAEFAACRGKMWNCQFFATFISNSGVFGLFLILPFIKQ